LDSARLTAVIARHAIHVTRPFFVASYETAYYMTGHNAAKKSAPFTTGPRLGLEARYESKTNGNCYHYCQNLRHVD
jgi:hypothetical protein